MDSPDPLLKVAKIVRAAQHAKALEAEVNQFFAGENSGIVPDFDSDPGYLVIRAFSKGQFDPYWSVVIGEALYQLRSTLDHLACHLTEKAGNVVDDRTEFPIFLKREAFRDSQTGKLKDGIERRIGGISPADQAIIEEEQPFNRKNGLPEDDPLWVLYGLSNFGRHRDLHLVSTAIRSGLEEFSPAWFADRYFTQVSNGYGRPFEGETEVARYRIDPRAHDRVPAVQVQVKANATFDIAFSDKGPGAGRPVVTVKG